MSHPPKDPAWQPLASRTVFENPWIRVRDERVLGPGGKECEYGVVHFKHRAVGIVAVDERGQTILVGQHRYPLNYYSWEIPEGGCRRDEDLATAAARELEEETGLSAARWDYLGCLALSNSVTDETATFFLARDLTPGPPHPDTNEVLAHRWLSLDAACDQALEGELNESLTVAALLRARHFLECEKRGASPPDFRRNP